MDKVSFYFLLNRISFWATLIGSVVLVIGLLFYTVTNGRYEALFLVVFVISMMILHVVSTRRIIAMHGEMG